MSRRGLSLIEVLVTLSVVATVLALLLPVLGEAKRRTYVTHCLSQLRQIGMALRMYEQDNDSQLPWSLGQLAPHYLPPDLLACPWIIAMDPEGVRQEEELHMTRRGAHYTSYFMFNQRALDDLCQKGEGVISYSRVVAMRGEDTPLVLCRQHREPFPPCSHCRARWYFPEQPVLVLRRDGRVNLSLKGGTMRDGTMIDTMMDALEL